MFLNVDEALAYVTLDPGRYLCVEKGDMQGEMMPNLWSAPPRA